MNWELFGCGIVFVLLMLAALFVGCWLDDQGEPDWWGREDE